MGTLYDFTCAACGYTAASGGMDRGIDTVYVTVHCLNCRELMDVLAGRLSHDLPPPPPSLGAPATSPPPRPTVPPKEKLAEVKWRCRTGRFHRLEPWQPPGPCPKCGEVIERGEPVGIWD
ncbi:hypothetical protein Dcar01_03701 [Deinococcus carri]|uniref:Zinc ribbon domain-containing protein n=1 Tax=Deinococcus carri TaxID=1211323 RepID=A0ABP9WC86_9DEIO